jgi:hypothetical protein
MSNQVYANNMEVSCKAADGKSICAFPDVCMTPPQTPATPPGVPIPYPNTGMASDTSDGSTSVKVSDQEVMLKNKSCFKKSTGDEAGAAPMKGVMTHKIMGKVYFTAWSMDVLLEGENAVRTADITTHNHGSSNNTPPTGYIATNSAATSKPSPTYGLRRDMTKPCAQDPSLHNWVCDKTVCADCWNPKCTDNEKIIEDEYKKTQGDSENSEKSVAENAIAAIQKKIDGKHGDIAGLKFEQEFIGKVLASNKHTLVKAGYQIHCIACHLRVDIDIITDKYIIEVKRSSSAFHKKQLDNNIIPAAKKCFPMHTISCATNDAEMDDLCNDKLPKWGNGVEGFIL